MNTIEIKNNPVSTFSELKSNLHPDGQGSGTLEGWVKVNGSDYFVRKHWSYSGGFPMFTDDTVGTQAGEIILDGGKAYCEGRNQTLYNNQGQRINDADLEVRLK